MLRSRMAEEMIENLEMNTKAIGKHFPIIKNHNGYGDKLMNPLQRRSFLKTASPYATIWSIILLISILSKPFHVGLKNKNST